MRLRSGMSRRVAGAVTMVLAVSVGGAWGASANNSRADDGTDPMNAGASQDRAAQILRCVPRRVTSTARVDLNGAWTGSADRSRFLYYVSQSGRHVSWVAMEGVGTAFRRVGRRNTHLFYGVRSGARIRGHWVDVPRGHVDNAAPLRLRMNITEDASGNAVIAMTRGGDGNQYGVRRLTPCTDPGSPSEPDRR